ncbi:sugar efflux transporter [Opitutus sp. ER46]|uniref:sugar efflux transporter n=1 Tax=Opitutus sp. ER46 TaxID=2161864 RepID=UPI000D317790|nr:sugar efflux transporter [Opitutus sp. ER46]PTX95586.1 MFS transporter [Opitutus sp. ER46]
MSVWLGRVRVIFAQPGFPGVMASAFALGLGYSFVGPFLSLWGTQEVGMRPSYFGLFMTLTSLSAILVITLLARWSDTHVPRKVMLLLGGTGGVIGYSVYAFVREPWILLTVGCSVLAFAALCFSQLFAFTRERYYHAEIPGLGPGFLMSIVRVGFSVAWTAGPSIGAWMMVTYGFRGSFLGAALLYFVFLVGVVWFVPYERRPAHVRAAVHEPVWRVLTRGEIAAMFVAFLCVYASHTMNAMNLPLMLTQDLGATGRDVGIAFGVGPAVEIPLMLWFGLLAGRGYSLRLLRIGGVVTALYFVLLNQVQAPWHVFIVQALHGMSFAIISNVGIMFFQNLVPGQPGLATAVYANAANVGNLVGFFTFGNLVGPLGHRRLFLCSAVLAGAMAVIMFLYRGRARTVA